MWFIERRHFQWPWTTSNLVFKVTPFFDTEYLTNGYRHGHSYYRRRPINRYISQTIHSYYGRRIGTCMRSIKSCHFQWPWTNTNPFFKVTPFFDTEYLTNGDRYGHNYHRRRIGNHTPAFEWHQFQWLWVTCNHDFKVTILFNVKKLETGTR